MKKTIYILFALFITLLFANAYAESKTYSIDSINASMSFPDSCYVFYEGMPDSEDAQKLFGGTTKEVLEFIKAQGVLVYVVFDDFETEATITYATMNPPVDFNSISLMDLKDAGKSVAEQYEAMGAEIINYTPYEANGKRIAQVSLKIALESETSYRSLNMITNGNQLVQIVFTSVDNPITEAETELFKQICGSIVFE